MKIYIDFIMVNMTSLPTSRDLFAGSRNLARSLDSANKSRNVEVKDFSCVSPAVKILSASTRLRFISDVRESDHQTMEQKHDEMLRRCWMAQQYGDEHLIHQTFRHYDHVEHTVQKRSAAHGE